MQIKTTMRYHIAPSVVVQVLSHVQLFATPWTKNFNTHWNMYIIKCETDHQSRLEAWDKCSGLVHWDDPVGGDGEGGGEGVQDGEHM